MLGIYLVYRAYTRTQTGWLDYPVLQNMFYDIAASFRPIAPIPGTNIQTNIVLFDYFQISAHLVDNSMLMWFRSVPVNSFLQTFVLGNQMFWQTLIIVFEIAIGLALIGGLFTKLAGLGVIFWSFVVLSTVGLSIHQFWLPFAAFACFGAGNVISFDYYVSPWLKKKWRNIPFVKKWYLYND